MYGGRPRRDYPDLRRRVSDDYVRGRRIGVDGGLVRVGVALSDPDGILATPLTTLQRDPRKGFDVKLLAGLVQEHGAVGVYVGLPRSLDGGENASTAMARDYAAALVRRLRAKGWEVTSIRLKVQTRR